MSDETSANMRLTARRKSIATLAGSHAEAAVAALVAVMNNTETAPAARIAAANTLLQWSFGKPSAAGRDKMEPDRNEEAGRQIVILSWAPE